MEVAGTLVLASILAGLFSLDRSAFGQFQLSRPLVAAPVLGYVLGCPTEGAIIGLLYELLFLRSLPVGSFIPNHPLFPSLVTVLLVGTYSGGSGEITGALLIGPAVLFGLPTFAIDQAVNILWRRSNEESYYRAEAFIRLGRENLAQLFHLLALLRAGLFHGGAFLLCGAILIPLFGAAMAQYPNLVNLLAVVAVIPFITGLAGIAGDRIKQKGWLGFAAGLAAGVGTGIWWTVL